MSKIKAGFDKLKRWLKRVAIAIDQLLNTVLGADPDETFSARCWRKAQAGQWFWRFMRSLIDLIFFWQDGHCRLSYESERRRLHLPKELRGGL